MLQAQGDHDPSLLLIVRHHHELLDGGGYPSGLQDHQIDQKVRIATLCDIFAALIEERPYKSGFPAARAVNTMAAMHGKLDQELLALLACLFVPTSRSVELLLNPPLPMGRPSAIRTVVD